MFLDFLIRLKNACWVKACVSRQSISHVKAKSILQMPLGKRAQELTIGPTLFDGGVETRAVRFDQD